MNESFRDEFVTVLCRYEAAMRLLFAFVVMMVVLALLAFPAIEPGTGAYVLVQIDLVLFLSAALGLAGGMWLCRNRQ